MIGQLPTVGVRELRQNLSVYLRRVAAGETLRVTEHGLPVALLTPLPERMTARDRLIAAGKLIPGRGGMVDLPLPPPGPRSISISEALEEQRAERL
jgi:prevent-host-death family protein